MCLQHSLSQGQVDDINSGVLSMIREKNPTRLVVYGGQGWNSAGDMMNARIPDGGNGYLIATYHSYDPFDFAHECNDYYLTDPGRQHLWNQFASVASWIYGRYL